VPQIGEFIIGVQETSKLGGIKFISLLAVGVFTLFNCGLVPNQHILIIWVPQIGESPNGVRETSKFRGAELI
jgi:hypothetical protein